MAATENKTSPLFWAKLHIDYFKDAKIIEAGPIAETAFVRLIAMARAALETAEQTGAVSVALAKRELRDVQDINSIVTPGSTIDDLFHVLEENDLITMSADGKTLTVTSYGKWQTTREDLALLRENNRGRKAKSRAEQKAQRIADDDWDAERSE